MTTPYHLLATAGNFIFAARGNNIHSFSSSLSHVSTWRHPGSQEPVASSASPGPPPSKRRRVGSDGGDEEKGNDAVDEAQNPEAEAKGKVKEKDPNHQERPFLHALSVTSDGRHLVALTGSDKTIWVFEHDGAGHLKLLSQRAMQKRPCAIAISYDGETILSADKFGDVYSLPLIPSATDGTKKDGSTLASTPRSATPSTPQPFKPQANEFTVHTKRNLKALENQKLGLQTKALDQSTKPQFEHTLLLGHVSMLTTITVAKSPHNGRPYIITGDRDEHIRISRGHPAHAHIIEGYCLAHDAFVTSLCSPPSRPEILISGGGDDDLFVWKWANNGLLVNRPQLRPFIEVVVPGVEKIAVTRIVAGPVPSPAHPVPVFVLCERVPAVFIFELNGTFLWHQATVRVPGNALDIVALPATVTEPQSFLVAVDPIAQWADDGISLVRLGKEVASKSWRLDEDFKRSLEMGDGISREEVEKLLYSTENLRKSADGH